MTVTELIAALEKMPPEMTVRYVADEPVEVATVEVCTEPQSWGGDQWVRID